MSRRLQSKGAACWEVGDMQSATKLAEKAQLGLTTPLFLGHAHHSGSSNLRQTCVCICTLQNAISVSLYIQRVPDDAAWEEARPSIWYVEHDGSHGAPGGAQAGSSEPENDSLRSPDAYIYLDSLS